jgi:hypothetical protein
VVATGLLVMAACLFHSYRRQFGESLIQLGERLGARPQAQMQLVSPAPQTALPARRAASPPPVPIPLPRPEKSQPQALADPAKLQWKLEPARPATAAPSAAVAHAPALKAPAVPGTVATTSFRAVEDCLISWESYSANAIVKFVQDDYVVATANGRWVNRALRFEHDAFVYRKNDDGSRTLIEIRFAGMRQALVFDKLS